MPWQNDKKWKDNQPPAAGKTVLAGRRRLIAMADRSKYAAVVLRPEGRQIQLVDVAVVVGVQVGNIRRAGGTSAAGVVRGPELGQVQLVHDSGPVRIAEVAIELHLARPA